MSEEAYRKRERQARIGIWLAKRASRNTGWFDRVCRRLMLRLTKIDPEKDFMRDDMVDQDAGFSVEELQRFERGE